MSFLNFCISIFSFKITPKYFVLNFLATLIFLFLVAFILKQLDFKITNNDIIKSYQIEKIKSKKFQEINTIFVGDSSGGNAINNVYFNKLSDLKSENLCLTGSWGLNGSLGIIKKAFEKNKNIKNIIIIQTLDIWEREYSKESILELFTLNEQFQLLDNISIISNLFNLKEIWWHLKYITTKDKLQKIDLENDYLLQREEKYSNNKLYIKDHENFNKIKISQSKNKELKMLEVYCKDNSLNCIFLNGPIHKNFLTRSIEFKKYINSKIEKQFSHIKYYNDLFIYEQNKIGDSYDHVDIKYKNESTLDYFKLLQNELVY
ncbi:MAG: hypothetical protein HOK29_13465 [Candidatus Marinimicrobia bacterium]|jgi:hypothetical protein|nr:hypothetical protein [Candidatus Neomarinimicrobiota bacterium]